MSRPALLAGALLAGVGVTLGAFGAHGLRDVLDAERLGWWHTAVSYQMWHAIGLIALAAVRLERPRLIVALLGIGTLVFSGSLYLMALTDWRWLGMITPIGGATMIAGWGVLAWSAFRSPE
ncbi:MAG TPA: DUF423 domain-containing protein [Allosphingosinicella sp.]|nr:DUF423 domain-containing protein [Allosphingosinicella sp.]HJQ60315.1 DUF423 domain-containing protein [Vineibacter sp.]HKT13911.1 DUF423 domain-containing protein [Allosphingosinicella sp.]